MQRTTLPGVMALALLLAACSPSLNWRSVRSDAHALQMLLPCKPDQASREVDMAGAHLLLDMQGCDAAGATFAVSHVRLADAQQVAATLAGWQAATLAHLHAAPPQPQPFSLAGAWSTVRWAVTGQRADGQPVRAQALWFAHAGPAGVDLFHAVVYADKMDPAAAETFFTGLKFD